MEATADRLFGHSEFIPGLSMTSAYLLQCFIDEMQRSGCSVSLEVGSGAIAFDGVTPLWNLPLELYLWLRGSLRQANLDTLPGGFDIASQVYEAGQSRYPQACKRSTTGIQGQIIMPIVPA